MNSLPFYLFLSWLSSLAVSSGEVSFSKQIAPLLQSKCIACHGAEKAKGGFRAHTYEQLMRGGESDLPSIKAGDPAESELYKRLISEDEDERMPQKDDPLPTEQIELFKQWISEGAKLDAGEPNSLLNTLVPDEFHPQPPPKYAKPVPILALTFNSAGTELFTGGYHEIIIWDLEGKLLRRLTNVAQRVHSIALHPSGNFLAVAGGTPGRNGEIAIYETSSGERKKVFLKTQDEMLCLAFDKEGKQLAAGGSDSAIHLFDWESGKEAQTIQQHADWVTALAFSDDGKKVASASRDRTARVYSTDTGELETTYTGHGAAVNGVEFLSNDLVGSGGREKEIHLWKVEDGKKQKELSRFTGEILALLKDNECFFSASADKLVRQHSIKDGELIRNFDGHKSMVFSLAAHKQSRALASGSYDGEVRIWNIDTGDLKDSFIAAPLSDNQPTSIKN